MTRRFTKEDFYAFRPKHNYIFAPTGEFWTAASVNAELGTINDMKAASWLDLTQAVEQITWAPGEDVVIHNRLTDAGGFIDKEGATVFNTYRPPDFPSSGDPDQAAPWLHHVRKIYPDDVDHIVRWFAHRVQRPEEKINHALVFGGLPGIGKDTLIAPLTRAIGAANFQEINPKDALEKFNGFLKAVALRISEARDLGEVNRYDFYNRMKTILASPPEVLRINEKHLAEYYISNVVGVIITANLKADLYLPPEDRRHYVAWSNLTMDMIPKSYWPVLWAWYDNGGYEHVAAYLKTYDLSQFDAKAPPAKTQAFWEITEANRAAEDAELSDVLDELLRPEAVTLESVVTHANGSLHEWLVDRKNRRTIVIRMEKCGYTPVRNDTANDGLWKIHGKRQVVYARDELPLRAKLAAARGL